MSTLERSIREYVAEGSGLSTQHVIPGNSKGPREIVTYASVLLMSDDRLNYPIRAQRHRMIGGQMTGYTDDLVYRRARYSLQFYRAGATENAVQFDTWAMSENGLTWAQTAFPNGQIDRIRVYDGGSGYDDDNPPAVHIEGGGGTGATAQAVMVRGAVSGVRILNRGTGYAKQPDISFIPSGTETGSVSPASATASGLGFTVEFPLSIRRIDAMIADEFEERVLIELAVVYARIIHDNTGIIDAVDCEVEYSGEIDTGRIQIGGL